MPETVCGRPPTPRMRAAPARVGCHSRQTLTQLVGVYECTRLRSPFVGHHTAQHPIRSIQQIDIAFLAGDLGQIETEALRVTLIAPQIAQMRLASAMANKPFGQSVAWPPGTSLKQHILPAFRTQQRPQFRADSGSTA